MAKQANEIRERLHQALLGEASLRNKRTPDEWIESERKAMLDIVNGERTLLNKLPASLADVKRVEDLALGHCDYARKYALYCSELVEEP